jgi:dTDP-4-amino-4,6-dideoxygalactose transaminase
MLRLTRGTFGAEESRAVARVLESGHTSMGREVAALEEEWVAACGKRHAVAVSSCTAALRLAPECVFPPSLVPPGPLTTASLTFCAGPDMMSEATGDAPEWRDITALDMPVADNCVLATHYNGIVARVKAWSIEDCAHCHPYQVGVGHGYAQCWSLHGTKTLSCGEGGMLTTDDGALADAARELRRHGIPAAGRRPALYTRQHAGWNFCMSDIAAAVARVQLSRLPLLLEARHDVLAAYRRRIPLLASPSCHLAIYLCPPGVDRDALRAKLLDAGIETSVHYPPCHTLPPYSGEPVSLPLTEEFSRRAITLPLHAEMTAADVAAVCAVVEGA